MSNVTGQIAQSLLVATPYLTILLVGIVVALVRWQRHPAVSILLVGALGAMLLTSVGYRVAFPLIVAGRGNVPISSIAIYLAIIGIVIAFIRTVCWAAVIAAVLGWRSAPGQQRSVPLQFSIQGLIAVTFLVAILCGFGRMLVGVMGDASPTLIQVVDDLPIVVCLGIGSWIVAVRWSRHPTVSLLAILSFATAIAVALIPQLLTIAVLQWSADPMLLPLLNIVALLASSLSWALAIVAALGWRSPEPQVRMPIA